jgi:hypothetical protein
LRHLSAFPPSRLFTGLPKGLLLPRLRSSIHFGFRLSNVLITWPAHCHLLTRTYITSSTWRRHTPNHFFLPKWRNHTEIGKYTVRKDTDRIPLTSDMNQWSQFQPSSGKYTVNGNLVVHTWQYNYRVARWISVGEELEPLGMLKFSRNVSYVGPVQQSQTTAGSN